MSDPAVSGFWLKGLGLVAVVLALGAVVLFGGMCW
jgi:hypothetical protein